MNATGEARDMGQTVTSHANVTPLKAAKDAFTAAARAALAGDPEAPAMVEQALTEVNRVLADRERMKDRLATDPRFALWQILSELPKCHSGELQELQKGEAGASFSTGKRASA